MRIMRSWERGSGRRMKSLLQRRPIEDKAYLKKALKDTRRILSCVRREGDRALLRYTSSLDGVKLSSKDLLVRRDEIQGAYLKVDDGFIKALRAALREIVHFHLHQRRRSWRAKGRSGIQFGELFSPIERVGVYVPGGRAAYPSTLLMGCIPAKVAGVKRIIIATPPGRDGKVNPHTLVAAGELGVWRVYRIGGAQAIGALAFGTKTIPKVDKIVGPGNIFVTLAKREVYGEVGIDGLYGPSEIMILADRWANPKYIAQDLISQAEHDGWNPTVLVTTSESLAREVNTLLSRGQSASGRLRPPLDKEREEVISKSLKRFGAILITKTLKEAIGFINDYGPEHLELMVKKPNRVLSLIRNAGAIFLGSYSPVALGDYLAGPNHILPTGGGARFSSGLRVDDFLKSSTIISSTKGALKEVANSISSLARAEGLPSHTKAIEVRISARGRSSSGRATLAGRNE